MCVAFLTFVQLAKKYHPDRNKGDSSAAKNFTKIGEAYEVCSYKQTLYVCGVCMHVCGVHARMCVVCMCGVHMHVSGVRMHVWCVIRH